MTYQQKKVALFIICSTLSGLSIACLIDTASGFSLWLKMFIYFACGIVWDIYYFRFLFIKDFISGYNAVISHRPLYELINAPFNRTGSSGLAYFIRICAWPIFLGYFLQRPTIKEKREPRYYLDVISKSDTLEKTIANILNSKPWPEENKMWDLTEAIKRAVELMSKDTNLHEICIYDTEDFTIDTHGGRCPVHWIVKNTGQVVKGT